MGKITRVVKSKKEHVCSKCGTTISRGSTYYWGKSRFSDKIIRCSICGLESWEVTDSEYLRATGELKYLWKDTYEVEYDTVLKLASKLEEVRDNICDKLDFLPEHLIGCSSETILHNRRINVEDAIDQLYDIDAEFLKSEVVATMVAEGYVIDTLEDEDTEDYDIIFNNNPHLQKDMEDLYIAELSHEIDNALSNLEV